jgi:hypothetical protein
MVFSGRQTISLSHTQIHKKLLLLLVRVACRSSVTEAATKEKIYPTDLFAVYKS